MGEVFAGRYELVDPIGRGGVGAVWRAWDHRRRRYVAAKVLQQSDAHALLRFVREQALRIDHPHVLAPASWAADDEKVLFTMDLVAGGSLVHLVNDYGPLPPLFVRTLIDQLLAGLASVHAEGVVHRDIKPANVLLEATGTGRPRLRLSDFGIAMRLGEPRLTETNYVVGTPGYFAPEQILGSEPDFPADLFAVGLVALYLLEGARPDAKALIEYFAEHGTPPAPRGIPEPLWQVVATLLQPDPDARFRTATGARKALAAAAELLPEPGPDDELIEVFDQLGPLPEGFGPEGPLGKGSPSETQGAHPAALFSPGHPDSTAAHLGPDPGPVFPPASAPGSALAPVPSPSPAPAPSPAPEPEPEAKPVPQAGVSPAGVASLGVTPAEATPVEATPVGATSAGAIPAEVGTDSSPRDAAGHEAGVTPSATPGVAPSTDPRVTPSTETGAASNLHMPLSPPSPHPSMSDTGSFHLPPPTPPPTPPSTPVSIPVSMPVPAPLAPPPAGMPQHAYAPTASYTARSAQVPPPQGPLPTAPVPGHRRRRARPRPGPPAKIAVPMLLLALACFAVGCWALTQI
ncbi:protein kinase [Streptomyces sp. NPDC007084]|uniref:protein kinase domain-containing protein n=1 Tax=Streptomyces sp. NPDC007084 TaxID=3154313 RepID=UPI003453A0AB